MSYTQYLKRTVSSEFVPFRAGTILGAESGGNLELLWFAARDRGDIIFERYSEFVEGGSVQHIEFVFKDEDAYQRVTREFESDDNAVLNSIFTDTEESIEGPKFWSSVDSNEIHYQWQSDITTNS